MQKVDSNSSAGTAADSEVQSIVTTSASIEANPMLPAVESGTLRPILFSTPMVQAILQGRKTQTRRIIKGIEKATRYKGHWQPEMDGIEVYDFETEFLKPDVSVKSKYNVGDILWVRETFTSIINTAGEKVFIYKADDDFYKDTVEDWQGWQPSLFMPKEACRLFLKVKNIRVEELQSINNIDAFNEGIEWRTKFPGEYPDLKYYRDYMFKDRFATGILFEAKHSFKSLWFKINGCESWEKNPFVWVIEFERCVHP